MINLVGKNITGQNKSFCLNNKEITYESTMNYKELRYSIILIANKSFKKLVDYFKEFFSELWNLGYIDLI